MVSAAGLAPEVKLLELIDADASVLRAVLERASPEVVAIAARAFGDETLVQRLRSVLADGMAGYAAVFERQLVEKVRYGTARACLEKVVRAYGDVR